MSGARGADQATNEAHEREHDRARYDARQRVEQGRSDHFEEAADSRQGAQTNHDIVDPVVRTGNTVHVRLEVGSQYDTVGVPLNLYEHRVALSMSPDTIRFDPRGFAPGVSGAYQTIRLSRGTRTDSVCVTRFGRIIAEGKCL